MCYKYFMLTLALIPSIAYTMDGDKKDKKSKHPIEKTSSSQINQRYELAADLYGKMLEPKKKLSARTNHEPFATHIDSMLIPILFHKRKQSFFRLLNEHRTNHFGDTPIVMASKALSEFKFESIGLVSKVNNPDEVATLTADQRTIYVSNTSRKYLSNKKYISLGTILIWKDMSLAGNESTKKEHIASVLNHFLSYVVMQQPEVSTDKNKQEEDSGSEKIFSESTESKMSQID